MKDEILITPQQFAAAYTRRYQPELADVKPQKKLKPKKK